MMTRLGGRVSALAVALVIVLAAAAGAQTTTGRISGTVADASGGVLPGVSVTVVNDATALARTTTTDGQGAYVFVDLPVGTYTVKTELAGFKSAVRTGNTLNADGRVTVDFKLDVGSVAESVEVTAAGETVNTVSGEVARVVDAEQVKNM